MRAYLAALVLVSSLGLLGDYFWLLELTNHFRPQLLLLALAGLLAALATKSKTNKLLALVPVALNLAFVYPALDYSNRLAAPAAGAAPGLTILSANVNTANRRSGDVLALIAKHGPDAVLVLEVNERWIEELRPLEADYPYRLLEPRGHNFGIALYSRIPFDGVAEIFDGTDIPYLDVVFADVVFEEGGAGREIRFFGLHVLPPVSAHNTAQRNWQMAQIAGLAAAARRPVVVMGDLNDTPWSNNFTDFLRLGGLTNGAAGHGWIWTWPAGKLPLAIQIDHALTKDLMVERFQRLGSIGSDHFPILVTVRPSFIDNDP